MADEFLGHTLEDWLPISPLEGPPLPKWMGITWPWYKVTPPVGEYVCAYCGQTFATYDELVAHIQSVHPGERIPLPIEWE